MPVGVGSKPTLTGGESDGWVFFLPGGDIFQAEMATRVRQISEILKISEIFRLILSFHATISDVL